MTHPSSPIAFALHGGAGVTPGRDYAKAEHHMAELAKACRKRLEAGESALDVVTFAVSEMEASGLYVAGRGSAPNDAGYVELDASIMDGATRRAGAIAAARDVVSPVTAARSVLDESPHVLLTARGAEAFCRARGLEFVQDPDGYYVVPVGVEPEEATARSAMHGTVGAVALDRDGKLAAATSTGGIFGKSEGRVGDTPLIGAGTWADEQVAVSCTGLGESFILAGGALDVAARVRYGNQSLETATEGMIADVGACDGDGGVIAVDKTGRVAMAWNSPGMKRAWTNGEDGTSVGIY